MNELKRKPSTHERWAHLRFSVVGSLLSAPPKHGELQAELERLAAKSWLHPLTGEPTHFGESTIERWYHQARKARLDPVAELRRKVRSDVGQLNIAERHPSTPVEPTVAQKVEQHLAAANSPLSVAQLRELCRTRKATMIATLAALAGAGRINKTPAGYSLPRR